MFYTQQSICICFILIINVFHFGLTVPKKYEPNTNDGGFLPSSGTYYSKVKERSSSPQPIESSKITVPESRALTTNKTDSTDADSISERVQRFGLTGYGGGYGGTAGGTPGVYAPLKIDLGGVVLGTLIGLGAVLIFPKLAHVFSHGYGGGYGGGYARRAETTLTELMSNFETALEKYNIDSSSCMQRLVCTTVQNTRLNMAEGHTSTIDQWVEMLTKNQVFSGMLDGTAIKEAVDAGWGSDPDVCGNYYPKCAINKQKILQMVSNLIPS